MTKRNIEIKVRLSRKEAENLNKQVKKCRLSREAYLRHLITGEVPREAPPPEYFAFMREMHYVGHNLNQIAQKAHVLNVVDAKRYAIAAITIHDRLLTTDPVAVPSENETQYELLSNEELEAIYELEEKPNEASQKH